MLPYTSIEEVEDPEPGTVVRDEHGIAVLDPKVWVLDVRHEVFVNRTTLETMQWPDVLNDEYARARQDPCVKHMMLARKQASAFALSAATVVTPKGPNPVPHPELPKVLPDIGPLDLFGSPSLGGHGVYQFAVPEPTPSFWSALAYAAEDEARRTNDADFNVMGAHSEAADNVGASLARRVGEVLKALHPGVEGVRCSNAFVVNYHAGRADVPDYHQAHADRSDLTLNLCLGHNFKGGDLIFSEPPVPGAGPERKDNVPQPSAMVSKVDRLASAGGFASRVLGQPTKFHASDNDAKKRTGSVRVPHAVGHAVLHMGSLTHETASVVEGQRVNLICFLSVDMVPFPFVELPKDIQRFILLFLTPGEMTALAGTCRAVRTVISAHDAVWMDHFWRMFTTTSLVKEAEQLRSEGVSAKAVFMAAKELQCIGELASTIKSAVPKIMMKAMYDPDKESKELDKWKWSVREMGLQTEAVAIRRQKAQRFHMTSNSPFIPPGYLPAAGLSRWMERVANRTPMARQTVKTIDSSNLFKNHISMPFFPEPPVPEMTLRSCIEGAVAETSAVDALDMDGTPLSQFPWFWPTRSRASVRARGWYVQCTDGVGKDLAMWTMTKEGGSSVHIKMDNGQLFVGGKLQPFATLRAFVASWMTMAPAPFCRFPLAPVQQQ